MRIRSIHTERRDEGARLVDRSTAPAHVEALSEVDAARYIGMSAGWLKKSRTKRFRDRSDAPPFVRAGARRIVYRRRDLDAWLAANVESVETTGQAIDYAPPITVSKEAGFRSRLHTQR